MRILAVASAVVLAAAGAQAQAPAPKVFRCTDEKGAIIYTDKPAARCKTVRIDAPPAGAPKPAVKARPAPKARTVARAPEPRTQKTHCAAISKVAADFAAGKTGGLDAAGAAQRRAGVDKEMSENCR